MPVTAGATAPNMAARLAYAGLAQSDYFRFFDDMFHLGVEGATGVYTSVDDSSTGTNAIVTGYLGMGGWKNIVTAAADNDYHSLFTTAAIFAFQKGCPLSFQARVKVTEATADTTDAGVIVGLTDTTTTGGLTAGTVPLASATAAFWYKTEGTSIWRFGVQNAGAVTAASAPTTINPTLTLGNTYVLGFDFDPNDNVTAKITPWIINQGTAAAPVNAFNVYGAIDFALTASASAALMKIGTGCVAGTTGHAITLGVDWVEVVQLRNAGNHAYGLA